MFWFFNPSFNPKGQINEGVILADIDPKTKEFESGTQISINMEFLSQKYFFSTLPLNKKKLRLKSDLMK